MMRHPARLAAALRRRVLGLVALAWLCVVIVASLAAPLLAPYRPGAQDLGHVLSGPSAQHWLGSGVLGRDVLSRMVYGGRATLLGIVIACGIYLFLGVPLGILAGYFGKWAERIVLRLADITYAVPVIIILLVVVAIFPNNEAAAMVALGLLGAPGLARIVRSIVAVQRQELYIKAAVVAGLKDTTIMRRHLLPGLSGTIIVQLSIFAAGAVLLETGLGFLGLGSTDTATWGQLIAEASQNLGNQPWLLVPSGVLVISFVLALGLIGDTMRDIVAERHGESDLRGTARTTRKREPRRMVDELGPARPDALLSVRGLTVAFPAADREEITVVSDVAFDVSAGESVGIVGESGCGKSVTAGAILGLLRAGGHVTGGQVLFDGEDLTRASADTLREIRGGRIGWISQEPISSLDPCFTVGYQIREAIRAHDRCSRRAARARALELLGLVRLPNAEQVARRYPHQLSGGMAQRVGIAAALANDPALLIADEPTTALDVTVQAEVLDLLRDLQASGMAIVLVTHDWGVVGDLCQSAVVMYAGQVVESGTVADVIERPRHPYTAALLAANPQHARPGVPLPVIDGSVPAPSEWPVGCRFANRCGLVRADCTAGPIPLRPLPGRARSTRCVHADRVSAPAARHPDGTPLAEVYAR